MNYSRAICLLRHGMGIDVGVPGRDPWSFTAGDYRWLNISWGWDALASYLRETSGCMARFKHMCGWKPAFEGPRATVFVRENAK